MGLQGMGGSRKVSDHFTKGEGMKGILVIIAVLVFAAAGTAAEFFKWTEEGKKKPSCESFFGNGWFHWSRIINLYN